MMDDTALREACEAFLSRKEPHTSVTLLPAGTPRTTYGVTVEELLAFAKRQRAAGIREMGLRVNIEKLIESESELSTVAARRLMQWCEDRANALEEGA